MNKNGYALFVQRRIKQDEEIVKIGGESLAQVFYLSGDAYRMRDQMIEQARSEYDIWFVNETSIWIPDSALWRFIKWLFKGEIKVSPLFLLGFIIIPAIIMPAIRSLFP